MPVKHISNIIKRIAIMPNESNRPESPFKTSGHSFALSAIHLAPPSRIR
jgi:hypothetical protein